MRGWLVISVLALASCGENLKGGTRIINLAPMPMANTAPIGKGRW